MPSSSAQHSARSQSLCNGCRPRRPGRQQLQEQHQLPAAASLRKRLRCCRRSRRLAIRLAVRQQGLPPQKQAAFREQRLELLLCRPLSRLVAPTPLRLTTVSPPGVQGCNCCVVRRHSQAGILLPNQDVAVRPQNSQSGIKGGLPDAAAAVGGGDGLLKACTQACGMHCNAARCRPALLRCQETVELRSRTAALAGAACLQEQASRLQVETVARHGPWGQTRLFKP